jgi:hypothetical protein
MEGHDFPAIRNLDPGRFRFHVKIVIIQHRGDLRVSDNDFRVHQHWLDISDLDSHCAVDMTASRLLHLNTA